MSRLVLGIVALGLGFGVVHLGRPWHPEELKGKEKGQEVCVDHTKRDMELELVTFDRWWGGGDE